MERNYKYAANIITIFRIILSFWLLFMPPLSTGFILIYLICGVSDVVDGLVARHFHIQNPIGALLDSFADLILLGICFYKLLNLISFPTWKWVWCALITTLRIVNIVISKKQLGRVSVLHTPANKLTGVLLFFLPFLLQWAYFQQTAIGICVVATFASVQESLLLYKKETDIQ